MQSSLQVAQYRFVDRLAVGGMAEVFIAIAQGASGFEKPVVIKRLLPQLAETPRFHQMFLDEARILASLHHGNIVQILDMGTLDGLPFLALEYVDGRDLRSVVDRAEDTKTQLPYGLMAYIVSEVCRALDYAHRKKDEQGNALGIVHRDINPANIFLSHEGVVKVGDFGLAKALGKIEQSETGIIKGKISYLSPEQSEGLSLDHRSDIFSLGTTLYEATCGRRPFIGSNEAEIIKRIRQGRFVMPSRLRPDFPQRLEAVIVKAMEREPTRRFETAAEMRAALLQYLQQLPRAADDRQLTELLAQLFGEERRSQSLLIRLPPVETLPPPMVSVPHIGPFPEYRHEESPQRAHPPQGPAAVPRLGQSTGQSTGQSAGLMPRIEEPTGPLPAAHVPHAAAPPSRGRPLVWTALIVTLVAAIAISSYFVYRLYTPGATLELASIPPGAKVVIDGSLAGQKTPAVLALEVGRDYDVTLQHPGYADVSQRFNLRRPGPHAYTLSLPPLEERLQLYSTPSSADVSLEGELRGQTPLALRLKRGRKHAITLAKLGFSSKTIAHVADQESATLRISLDPLPPPPQPTSRAKAAPVRAPVRAIPEGMGMLELDVDEQARVFLDGKAVGTTPGFRRTLPPGTYALKVVRQKSGMEHRGSVTISAGKIQRIHLTP